MTQATIRALWVIILSDTPHPGPLFEHVPLLEEIRQHLNPSKFVHVCVRTCVNACGVFRYLKNVGASSSKSNVVVRK